MDLTNVIEALERFCGISRVSVRDDIIFSMTALDNIELNEAVRETYDMPSSDSS